MHAPQAPLCFGLRYQACGATAALIGSTTIRVEAIFGPADVKVEEEASGRLIGRVAAL